MIEKFEFRNAEHYADPTAFEALKKIREDENKMEVYRGDIFYIKKFSDRSTGELSEQGKPAVIVSNDVGNEHSEYVSVCYVVSTREKPLPTHVDIELNGFVSAVACESIHSVSKSRIGDFIRECSESEINEINRGLLVALALDNMQTEEREKIPAVVEEIPAVVQKKPETSEWLIRLETERNLFRELYENLLARIAGKG